MSIQWTIIATFLYTEVAVVLLLILPIASPKKWQRIFHSKFLEVLSRQATLYFTVLMVVLGLCLLDAIREMRKYSNPDKSGQPNQVHQLDFEMQQNMKLFRAQRNFHLTGFALFLSLVIRRLVHLISNLAVKEAQCEAAIKQAAGAASAAKDLLNSEGVIGKNETHEKEVAELKSQLTELRSELESERRDKKALKKQAEALNVEYDRLCEEHNKLEKKLAIQSGGDKKDD